MDSKGERVEWAELGDWDWHKYSTMCKIDICINLEGWDGEGDERGFQKGRDEKKKKKGKGCMYTYGWFMLRFDRKQQNSVKWYFSLYKLLNLHKFIEGEVWMASKKV